MARSGISDFVSLTLPSASEQSRWRQSTAELRHQRRASLPHNSRDHIGNLQQRLLLVSSTASTPHTVEPPEGRALPLILWHALCTRRDLVGPSPTAHAA
jgi:hypothetical protein